MWKRQSGEYHDQVEYPGIPGTDLKESHHRFMRAWMEAKMVAVKILDNNTRCLTLRYSSTNKNRGVSSLHFSRRCVASRNLALGHSTNTT